MRNFKLGEIWITSEYTNNEPKWLFEFTNVDQRKNRIVKILTYFGPKLLDLFPSIYRNLNNYSLEEYQFGSYEALKRLLTLLTVSIRLIYLNKRKNFFIRLDPLKIITYQNCCCKLDILVQDFLRFWLILSFLDVQLFHQIRPALRALGF